MKAVVVLGPILLVLLAQDPRLPARRGGLVLGAGFLVGNLPAWLFYLTQPDPGKGNLGSAGRFLESNVDLSWARASEFLTNALPLVVGTYYWEPGTLLRLGALGLCGALHAAAVALAGAEAWRALRGGVPPRRAWGLWLLLLTLIATYAALYGSTFNLPWQMSRGRYLLPAYIPLLLFLGAAIARLARRSRLAAAAALSVVLVFHLWTNLGYFWPLRPGERARRGAGIASREALARRLRAPTAEALLVDDPMESLRWQFLLSRPRISALTSEIYYPSAIRADAAERVQILASRSDDWITAQLQALGGTATVTRFGGVALFEDVRLPRRTYRLLPRTTWRVVDDRDAPPVVADGDLGTVWPARRLDESEAGELVLDLGAPQAVARLVFWPSALTDVIVPLEVAGSLDALAWQPVGVTPALVAQPAFVVGERPVFRPRNGWLELGMAPRPIRYLRVRPAEPDSIGVGMVGELYAYEAVDRPEETRLDLDALLRVVRARGVTRLLADPVVSARVDLATKGAIATVPANGVLNSHGVSPPPSLFARLRLHESDAALVPAEDAGDVLERLAAAGLSVASEPIGRYVLVQPVGPLPPSARCRPTDWRVTAEIPDPDPRGARYVVEGRLRERTPIAAIRLEHPLVSTRHATVLSVAISDGGEAWRPVERVRPMAEWVWAGRTLFTFSGGASELAVGGATGGAVRVEVRLPYRGQGAITSLCVRGPA